MKFAINCMVALGVGIFFYMPSGSWRVMAVVNNMSTDILEGEKQKLGSKYAYRFEKSILQNIYVEKYLKKIYFAQASKEDEHEPEVEIIY